MKTLDATERRIRRSAVRIAHLYRHCIVCLQSLFVCLLLVQWTILLQPAMASPIAPQVPIAPRHSSPSIPSSPTTNSTGYAAPSALTNLNLSSSAANVSAPNSVGHLGVNITVGQTLLSVLPGQMLTPAEMVAVYQVMRAGTQNIVLGASGAAIGGTVTIGPHLSSALASLTIPHGVTLISNSSSLKVSGNVIDSGNLFLTSTSPGVQMVSLVANTISIGPTGLISTMLPSGNPLSGLAPANVGLSINARNNIVNAGTISSGGALSLAAGGTIVNAAATGSGPKPTIQAAGDVNLVTGIGTIANAGVIGSANGSINISSINPSTDITIKAAGGEFQAAADINVRNPSYAGSNNINLNGGDYLSQNLNLYSGTGTITGNVGKVSGNLNSVAQVEHISAATNVLTLSDNTVSGDPTFVNTGGDIIISGVNTFNGNLAILASGNIIADSAGAIVDHGNSVTLIAGAGLLTSTGGAGSSSTTISGGTGASLLSSGTVTVNFSTSFAGATPGGTGGNIDLRTSSAPVVIDTTAVAANAAGGSVTLAAFANGINGGNVLLNASTSNVGAINTSGNGASSAGGTVNVYAGANPAAPATTIQLNTITTGGAGTGAPGFKGAINIYTAQPTANAGTTVSFDDAGTIGAGQSIVNAATLSPNGSVTVGNLLSAGTGGNGANITIMASNLANNGSVQTSGSGSIAVQSTGDLALSGTGSFTTGSSGSTTFQAASTGSSTLNVASGTGLTINGGGRIFITTPNLNFAGTSQIAASGSSNITIGSGLSGTDVPLNITGASGEIATVATNGGVILVRPTGQGTGSFLSSGIGATTIQLNAAGPLGNGLVDLQSLGDFSIAGGVTVSSNSPIQVNLNNNCTLTLNGVLSTTASNANFPDPLGGYMQYSILVQNLITNFTVAGHGSFVQAGATPGYTVFNDFTDVGFADGSNITFSSANPGSLVNFYTRQIQINGTGLSAGSSLSFSNTAAVNFNTNLPSFGPGDVAFVPGGTALSATLDLIGAPVNIGFSGVTPPLGIPTLQQPVGNINIGALGSSFSIAANNPIVMYATRSINVLHGNVESLAGNIAMSASMIENAGSIQTRNGSIFFNSSTPIGFLTVNNSGMILDPSAGISDVIGFNVGNGGTLSVVNNGTIEMLGVGSILGFSAGLSGAISLTGSGRVQADRVYFGNIDTSQWQIIPPAVAVPNGFSGFIQVGNVTLDGNRINGAVIQVASVAPPSPTSSVTQSIFQSLLSVGNLPSATAGVSQFNKLATVQLASLQTSGGGALTILPTDITRVNTSDSVYGNTSAMSLLPSKTLPLVGSVSEIVDGRSAVSIYLASSFLNGSAMPDGNPLKMTDGMSLFAPDSTVTVQTIAGPVKISAGAVVFIAAAGNEVAIYDLSDDHNGDVSLVSGHQQLNLNPGEQIVIRAGKEGPEIAEHLVSGIGQRKQTTTKLANGGSAKRSEFSILGILHANNLYRTMCQSPNPENRRVLAKVLKEAAAIQMATAGHGRYEQGQREQ